MPLKQIKLKPRSLKSRAPPQSLYNLDKAVENLASPCRPFIKSQRCKDIAPTSKLPWFTKRCSSMDPWLHKPCVSFLRMDNVFFFFFFLQGL